MTPILEVKNIVKHFNDIKAVDGISLDIMPGICFGLLGPNGAGKTTSIEVIEGILKPSSGEILYKGHPRGISFREEIGIQFQNTELPQMLSVKETLQLFRNLYNKKADLQELIDSCRLQEMLKQDNSRISGGQKQRLLLSIALANDPELIFLDEPTTGLDPQARRYLWEIVKQIKSRNKTIVLTTHYMEEAEILCDQIAIMDHGKILAIGSPQELLEKYCKGASIILPGNIDEKNLKGISCQWFKNEEQIEIQTDSLNICIQTLIDNGVDLSGMSVRSQNLEDLFLKLTGTQLRT